MPEELSADIAERGGAGPRFCVEVDLALPRAVAELERALDVLSAAREAGHLHLDLGGEAPATPAIQLLAALCRSARRDGIALTFSDPATRALGPLATD